MQFSSRAIRPLTAVFVVCLFAAIGGCESDEATEASTPKGIEVAGTWTDPFGTVETITDTTWDAKGQGFESQSAVVEFDNAARWAITRSSAEDAYSPNKFSKRIWRAPKDKTFYYCSVVFGLDTAELAKASTATADAGDLAGKGCGGFPWSKMTAQ